MKKSFLFAAFGAALALASCSSNDDMSTPDPQLAKLQENVAKYGKKSTMVEVETGYKLNWVDPNSNMWEDMPEVISVAESEGIIAAIQSGEAKEVKWPGYKSFYLQSIVNGGAHHTVYAKNTINGNAEGPFDSTKGMELMQIQIKDIASGATYWVAVSNYAEGRIKNAVSNYAARFVNNEFIDAKAMDENGGSCIDKWKIFYWKGNFYIAFDYLINAANKILEPDGSYDDSILKIIPSGEDPKEPEFVDPQPDPDPDPDPVFDPKKPEVEFDVEQQEHKDWKEIKTSIHLRDSVNARIFIPVPQEYQALADDFAIRVAEQYEYIQKQVKILDNTYTINMTVAHKTEGIEIIVYGTTPEAKQALRLARGLFDDGITFELHSYVYGFVDNATVWSWIKTIECVQTTVSGDPKSGDCCTYTYGQVHSAYFPDEEIKHKKDAKTACPAGK